MNQPTTTTADVVHARGVLAEATDEMIVLTIPETEYQLHLRVYQRPTTEVGKRIIGTIRARARRIDVVKTGGRYIEPLYGRPRRVQGQIVAIHEDDATVTVNAGVPVVCALDPQQKIGDFARGDFVSFDVLPGSSFIPHLKGPQASS